MSNAEGTRLQRVPLRWRRARTRGTYMNIIVNVDNNWAIGNKNRLLVSIPNDMKHFREETTGKVVVLGRKTLETFPQGQPLKNRTNIILSGDRSFQVKGAEVAHSLEDLMEKLKRYRNEDIYVTGGASVYQMLLPYCNVAHVTKVDHEYEADAYFPNLDTDGQWEVTADSEEQTYFDIPYRFLKYERKGKEKTGRFPML